MLTVEVERTLTPCSVMGMSAVPMIDAGRKNGGLMEITLEKLREVCRMFGNDYPYKITEITNERIYFMEVNTNGLRYETSLSLKYFK